MPALMIGRYCILRIMEEPGEGLKCKTMTTLTFKISPDWRLRKKTEITRGTAEDGM